MHALKSRIEDIKPGDHGPLARALLRSGVALLYAHWEGFTKEACQGYLDFVAKRKLKYSEMSDAFATMAIARLLPAFHNGDPQATKKILEFGRGESDPRSRLPRDGIVNTRSNLRHEHLIEILNSLGLGATHFSTREQLIDRLLCDRRNAIAHGREEFPSVADFLELYNEVFAMLDEIRETILKAARMKEYRRATLP